MSALVARLLLSMLLLPLSAAVVILTLVVVAPRRGPSVVMIVGMWSFVYTFIALYWILLWRDIVRWTGHRIVVTILAAVASMAAGALVAGFMDQVMRSGRGDWAMILLLSGAGVPLVWLFLTVLIWRESAAERRARVAAAGGDAVACPVCGYNLTGLAQLRCPECGASFTVENLIAAQRGREDEALRD